MLSMSSTARVLFWWWWWCYQALGEPSWWCYRNCGWWRGDRTVVADTLLRADNPRSLCSVKAARWWHSSCDILSSASTSGKLLIMSEVRSIAQEKFRTSVNFRISKHVYCSSKVYFPVFLSSSHDKLHLNNCQWTQFAIKNIILFSLASLFVIVCTS